MRNSQWLLAASLLVIALSPPAGAGSIKIAVSLSPAGSFEAKSSAVKSGSATKTGDTLQAKNFELDLNTLKTGIALRDKHMKEKYFETGKYPKAILTQATGKDGKFSGELQVHGEKQKISGTYELNGDLFVGKFKATLSQFKIAPAKYMGVGADDEVEVEITLKGGK